MPAQSELTPNVQNKAAAAAKLVIEKLPNNYLIASMKREDSAQSYITSPKGKPLKFLSLEHIKEFFQGERIDEIYLIDTEGNSAEIAYW